jgi:hypothetical protein
VSTSQKLRKSKEQCGEWICLLFSVRQPQGGRGPSCHIDIRTVASIHLQTRGRSCPANNLDPTSPAFEMADLETQARRQFLAMKVLLHVLTRFLKATLTPRFPQNASVPRHYLNELQRFLLEYPSDTNVSLTRQTRVLTPTDLFYSSCQFTLRNSTGCDYSDSLTRYSCSFGYQSTRWNAYLLGDWMRRSPNPFEPPVRRPPRWQGKRGLSRPLQGTFYYGNCERAFVYADAL